MLHILYKIYNFFRRIIFKTLKIKTVGVRALILNGNNEILLVRHTYIDGWYFPGGGVNARESASQAVVREVKEEVGGVAAEPVKLLGAYHNTKPGWDDYVLLVDLIQQHESSDREIAQACWFDLNELPSDITVSTKKHIEEHFFGKPLEDYW